MTESDVTELIDDAWDPLGVGRKSLDGIWLEHVVWLGNGVRRYRNRAEPVRYVGTHLGGWQGRKHETEDIGEARPVSSKAGELRVEPGLADQQDSQTRTGGRRGLGESQEASDLSSPKTLCLVDGDHGCRVLVGVG